MIIANKGLTNIQRRIGGVLNQEVRFISSDLSGKNKNPVISTEGALRLPTAYDNHPNPISSIHPIRPTYSSEWTKQA